MTRKDYFIELWCYWLKRLRIKEIKIRNDFRYNCHACVETWEDGRKELVLNSRKLGQWPEYLITNCVFHELGHLQKDLPYETDEEQIFSEFTAETYALKMQKKYYPKDYYLNCKWVKNRMDNNYYQKKWPIHYQAFLKIKEYTIGVNYEEML